MGGELQESAEQPQLLISVQKDPGTALTPGTDIQRVQVIKGCVDAEGNTREKVFDIAGDKDNGATVDPNSCAPVGSGISQSCTVWNDPEFEKDQNAFYYVRVLENPTCRWSTLQCQAAGVNPFDKDCPNQAEAATEKAQARGATGDVYSRCCTDPAESAFYSPVLQERAWSSPIWYRGNQTP